MNATGEPKLIQPDADDLTSNYRPLDGVFDEMVGPDGMARDHWRRFLTAVDAQPRPALDRMRETAQRLIRENGTTYNVYDENQDAAHPWRLDPFPFLISPDDWKSLEVGLKQRARLLNAIVEDIYGDQTLLKQGRIPPALVYGNPNFLRPLHGVRPPGAVHLHLLAFDLARGADGRWWVVSDRAQAPSGAGYALENRVAISRAMPEIFRQANAHRLGGFFQSMSDGLLSLARGDAPLAVLLTPGPSAPTYFEDAYLARYLGFPLVAGADLSVRDNRVYLKTLSGLRQVDLILRRIDGENCDPLELRADSLLGAPGLVEAVRAGNVVVANSLGSGVIQSDALMAFYPGLAERLLGEDLHIPSAATWWCGQSMEQDYVIANMDRLAIRPAYARTSILTGGAGVIAPGALTGKRRDRLIEDIRVNGHKYFGEEPPHYSTTPVWTDDGLAPRSMSLRMFVCFDGDDYRVMPGGMVRISDGPDAPSLLLKRGDAIKDAWALSENGDLSTFTRLPAHDQPVTLRRSGANLASRAADNLFWLGRYAERAENAIRLIRSMILRLIGETGAGEDPDMLIRLIRALIDLGHLPAAAESLAAAGDSQTLERELARMLAEPEGPNGLLTLLGDLDRIASLVRERLSVDSWRVLNNLRARAAYEGTVIRLDLGDAVGVLNAMLADLAAFTGMQAENMTRSLSWRMMDSGRRIERASHMTVLTREMAVDGDPSLDGRLDLLLELGDSAMTYRTRYITAPRLAPVADLLLMDETNPRSVAYQIETLSEHMSALPRQTGRAALSPDEYLIESLRSRLRLADIQALALDRADDGRRLALKDFLDEVEDDALAFSDALARQYFTHILPTRSAFAGTPRR